MRNDLHDEGEQQEAASVVGIVWAFGPTFPRLVSEACRRMEIALLLRPSDTCKGRDGLESVGGVCVESKHRGFIVPCLGYRG